MLAVLRENIYFHCILDLGIGIASNKKYLKVENKRNPIAIVGEISFPINLKHLLKKHQKRCNKINVTVSLH